MDKASVDFGAPQDAAAALTPSLKALWDALSYGIQVADTITNVHFSRADDEPAYWSYTVRHAACSYLEALPPNPDWMVKRLSLSGIQITHAPAILRVWKTGQSGSGPHAPSSDTQIRFCEQQQLSLPLDLGPTANFIVDWDTGEERIPVLHLSKPFRGWDYGEDPETALKWRQEIEFSADEELRFVGEAEEDLVMESILENVAERKAAGTDE